MDIEFSKRSRFLDACEAAILAGRAQLNAGGSLQVTLPKGGYQGKTIITIRPDDSTHFGSNWESADETRFPVRIKAAATVLINCGCVGNYKIVHADGSLVIEPYDR